MDEIDRVIDHATKAISALVKLVASWLERGRLQ
jgi:hypothetical protein